MNFSASLRAQSFAQIVCLMWKLLSEAGRQAENANQETWVWNQKKANEYQAFSGWQKSNMFLSLGSKREEAVGWEADEDIFNFK